MAGKAVSSSDSLPRCINSMMTGAERPFRFGVAMVHGVETAGALKQFAERVENLGYSSLLVGDHVVKYDPPSTTALAWVAANTTNLRLGTLVLANDFRHPAIVAKDMALVDIVSEGRLELGLGAGWLKEDYDALGLPYDAPGVRIDRLTEALRVIKSCWAGDSFDFAGEHYTITDYAAAPKPLQAPRPPIIIGGGSPRLLRLAGAEADIVGIHPSTTKSDHITDTQDERTRKKIGWIKEGAQSRFDELELMMLSWCRVTDDHLTAAAAIGEEFGAAAEATLTSAYMLIGTVDEICTTLQQRREAWGVSYIVLPAEDHEAFAPVVERLAGT